MTTSKRILLLVLVGVLAFSFMTGCNNKKAEPPKENEQTEETQDSEKAEEAPEVVEVDFEEVGGLDEETQKIIDEKVAERGYFVLNGEDDAVIMVVSSGEKPSGGYDIKVKAITEEEGVVKVEVEETEPAEGDVVTDALTYPYTVVKLDTTASEFVVVNTNGEEFANLDEATEETEGEEENKDVVEAEGTLNGQIDNNSVEILLDGEEEPQAFRIEELDGFAVPEDGSKVSISYYVNEEGQNVLLTLEVDE